MYRSVLRDILYLKVSGSSFGGKTYDNCKNAKLKQDMLPDIKLSVSS